MILDYDVTFKDEQSIKYQLFQKLQLLKGRKKSYQHINIYTFEFLNPNPIPQHT